MSLGSARGSAFGEEIGAEEDAADRAAANSFLPNSFIFFSMEGMLQNNIRRFESLSLVALEN
jgi:hypothetical protein